MQIHPTIQTGAELTTEKLLSAPASNGAVFRLVTRSDDRINGSIPSWGAPESSQESVAQALQSSTSRVSPETNLALSLSQDSAETKPDESFGFLDIVDMINPLQHIPVVGTIYRALTGDEIKPIAQIVGGAVFGGPIGAAGGIANAIVQSETGKDIGGNALAMLMGESKSHGIPETSDTTVAVAALSYHQPHYNE